MLLRQSVPMSGRRTQGKRDRAVNTLSHRGSVVSCAICPDPQILAWPQQHFKREHDRASQEPDLEHVTMHGAVYNECNV